MKFIAEYKCGCSDGPKSKSEMLDYCGLHGEDIRRYRPHFPKPKTKKARGDTKQ